MKTYSVLVNWNDSDVAEQGNFSWCGKAESPEDAERKARTEMWNQCGNGDEPFPDDIMQEFGTLLECGEGAYWASADLEAALRRAVFLLESPVIAHLVNGAGALDQARAALARAEGRA